MNSCLPSGPQRVPTCTFAELPYVPPVLVLLGHVVWDQYPKPPTPFAHQYVNWLPTPAVLVAVVDVFVLVVVAVDETVLCTYHCPLAHTYRIV